MKRLLILFLIIVAVFSASYFVNLREKPPEFVPLLKSNSPVVGIEKIDENKFLIIFMKSFVEHDDRITVYFGEGKISVAKIDPQKRVVEELWNYSLSGYRIFSFPYITNESIIIATVGSPNTHNYSELLKISLEDYKAKKIATLKDYILKINSFRDGAILLTGFDADRGKVVIIKNSSKVFERELGNRTMSSLVLDVNRDGYDDFIVSSAVFDNRSTRSLISIFLNKHGNFEEISRLEVPGMIWDMKLVKLGKKEIALLSPKSVYLLNLTSKSVTKIFEAEKDYYLSSVEIVDFDHDGFDEFFGVYHNETQRYFVELKYSRGKLSQVFKHPVSLKSFIVRWMKDGDFLIGSVEGLYLISV